eukprot:CAMPEP_0116116030 /NCGR_PEP_ID=MMETSP0329-20121206/821_1 /TAXON_ID=697910 /ORGANISM="Pseudo-nitzschia arenysensis, Strain B593" /LENGTH=829 /DNA_ID=CAMNT_0003609499 /DNA_START=8 /DNA_END=2497 /DNA_ORIENTATION=+
MAVVLPINSHIDFSNPLEKDYCQNEQETNENESSSNGMFTNRDAESTDSENESVGGEAESNHSMDTGDSSDDCDEKSDTLPLNVSAQNDSTTGDSNEEEERTPNDSPDNYWLVDNETPEESRLESNTPEEENSAFTSSIMAVDLAITNNDNHETLEPSDASKVSNIVDAIIMEETNATTDEDEMNFKLDEIPTAPAILVDDLNATNEENDDDNNMNLSSPTSVVADVVPEVVEEKTPTYGGLNNLGNTCYMASAIQLLCGLDSFPADLKSRIPPPENNKEGETSLRDALLDVMDRLGKGETVRPDDLKRCIDSRTSLFLGYHQQDSHEFLTTLLDIIDEDYKVKAKPEETTEPANDDSSDKDEDEKSEDAAESNDMNEENSNDELEDVTNCAELPASIETETIQQECNDDENDCDCTDDGSDPKTLETPLKKQKVVEEEPLTAAEAINSGGETTNISIQKSKSYSDFKFSDIENLLHDKDESSAKATEETSPSLTNTKATPRQEEPKCKLAGGRMSTAGVELTRFVDETGIGEDVQHTGVSLENATPQQQIVESTDHDMEESVDSEASSVSSSPVSSNFTTKVRVCLTCESCKFRRSHIETYLHLSLDISNGSNDNNDDENHDNDVCNLGCPSSSSIEEGLRRFFAPEKRDIKCEKCFHTSALQTSEITQLPRNLLFHLKRFIVDVSPDYSSISYRKDQSAVAFDERMELEGSDSDHEEDNTKTYHPLHRLVHDDEERGFKDFLAPDCVYEPGAAYEIRSVVNHIGSSASCGHYTADAKRIRLTEEELPATEEREWMRFNDSYVSTISSIEAVKDASQTAYMIMYELVQ